MPVIKKGYGSGGKKQRGALSVEAAVTFPFFILFLLMLASFIKISYVNIALNHAVCETARHIASAGYPIALLNELEDEVAAESPDIINELSGYGKSTRDGSGTDAKSTFEELLKSFYNGNEGNIDFQSIAETALNEISGILEEKAEGAVVDLVKGEAAKKYIKLKQSIKVYIATNLVKKLAESPGIDTRKLKVKFISLPQSFTEYDIRQKDSSYLQLCSELGLSPGIDDVVIAVDYEINMPITFMKSKQSVLRCVAVEKAWLNGGSGIYSNGDGSNTGGDVTNDSGDGTSYCKKSTNSSTVFITRTGIRYHKSGCRYLARSRISCSKEDAETKGYTPCKVCFGNAPRSP